ncbi:hypothetical protein [Sphingobium baderi]|uniref:hypothetical protein n=1 Tax=Sphingobium baderi TaxID=1332080 RepID=UPI002B40C56B|nr:hypothetical protein [Sphingobium baderi]WRD78859.1 hypothetical protein QQ987_19515 [Sphingobium baderi]
MTMENVRAAIAQQMRIGKLVPTAAMALVSALSRAGIEVGEDIRGAMDHAMIQTGAGEQHLPTPDVAEMLKDLVQACEGDPFLIQNHFAELTAAMPAGLQLSLLEGLVLADDSSLREVAIGWLLAEPVIATPLASMIEETAIRGLVSATSVTNRLPFSSTFDDREKSICLHQIALMTRVDHQTQSHPSRDAPPSLLRFDPCWSFSDQVAFPSGGHSSAAIRAGIMSAMLDSPERHL